jgi:hypothetical protein
MESMHYIGLDIHKKIIVHCIKTSSGVLIFYLTILIMDVPFIVIISLKKALQ